MLNTIIGWLAGAGLFFVVAWYVLLGERKKATQAQQLKGQKQTLDNVEKANDAEKRVDDLSPDERRDRLRQRDDK